MNKPLKNSKLDEFLNIVKYMVWGFLIALVLVGVLFLTANWKGFMKFIKDPAFFNNIEISRDYQLKK